METQRTDSDEATFMCMLGLLAILSEIRVHIEDGLDVTWDE